jgi:hypothetical protein
MAEDGLSAAMRVVIPITQGGINNNYVSLAESIDFFPAETIGPASEQDGNGVPLTLHFAGLGETVRTDIAGVHLVFRRRGPWRRFFTHHGLVAGDSVVIERRAPLTGRPGRRLQGSGADAGS